MGGLLLWLDARNFLRLDWGSGGRYELSFMGCLGGVNAVIGRGRLPGSWVDLRLIRKGAEVAARCRGDEGGWYAIGSATFAAGPVAAGLFAVGLVDRTLYPDLELSSAQMRFEQVSAATVRELAVPRRSDPPSRSGFG